jgi:hypothetical protein
MSMIERMLNEDIRDKKRTGNGIHHKTGSRGYVGKMMFASDLMTARQKRHYTRSGECMSWNMKTVLPKLEFDAYEVDQQREMLKAWRVNFANKEIMAKMGLTNAQYYKLLDVVGVPKDRQTAGKKINGTRKAVAITSSPKVIELVEKKPTIQETTAPVFTEGLNFNINGSYTSETLINWFTKLQMLVEGMDEIDVVVHLREKKSV